MKNLRLLVVCLLCSLFSSAQAPTGFLQITLHKNLLLGSCDLSQDTSNIVYIHSGAGYKSPTHVWDAVVGNWGKKDGIGEMATIDDSTYTICMDISANATDYFSNVATANADSGIMPVGSTIYNIGCVFRDQGPFAIGANGQPVLNIKLKGGANDNCSDFWIIGVNTSSISVVEEFDGSTPQPAVEAAPVASLASCPTGPNGVKDISAQLIPDIQVSPNPFTDYLDVKFNMVPDATQVRAQVYDVMGRLIADFTPAMKGGFNSFRWDGSQLNGANLPTGTYLIKVTNGTQVMTKKIVKQ